MFSKDPSELLRKDNMDREEIARSIRLSLAAELDAINFYLQQSRLIPDGSFRSVHRDIAKEEVTHFGEFLRLLHEYEPDEFAKIREGWDEASELLGSNPGLEALVAKVEEKGEQKMEMEHEEYIPHFTDFKMEKWEQDGIPIPEDQQTVVPIKRLSYEFSISKDIVEPYRKREMKKQTRLFRRKLLKYLLLDQKLSLGQRSEFLKAEDWETSGKMLEDIIKATEKLYESGYVHHIKILASPAAFHLMLRQAGDTGQTELDLIKEVVKDVEVSHALEGEQIYVMHAESFWILVRQEPVLKKISETPDSENYLLECRMSSLLFDHKASINFKHSIK